MYLRERALYETWEDLWKKGYQSPYFQAAYDEKSEMTDWSISDRQLFVQSNGRTMIGQDTLGRLHFICTPHDKIYAIPSGGPDVGGQFKGHIGQYYQNDTALLLGKMNYEIELANGLRMHGADPSSNTWYLDQFLPVTASRQEGLETKVFSLAPVLESESLQVSKIHPLPGPAGALYCMEIKNTSGTTLKGRVKLSLDQKFVNQFEKYGECFEDYTQNPYRSEWDQKLLVLWHPEACAAIQLLDGTCEGDAGNPRMYVPFELKAGESRVFTTIAAVTPKRDEVHEALGMLYQHTSLEWVNITAEFWKDRFGDMRTGIREDKDMGAKYRDMHIRFILDNFNCLSFDSHGNLLTNWQGAPSHSLSRLWGIDIEPDVVSVMYVIPEIGQSAMEYLAKRNVPRFSIYSDHSIFFYVAPLVIAGKYLELTADQSYFRENRDVTSRFQELYEGMLKAKHPDHILFSSHYASDLIVFKKYDYGANVKCFYALKGYRSILKAVGEDTDEVDRMLKQMPIDMAEYMEDDGPFGKQITGGNNMGENREDHFYVGDNLYYYGGEDTATVMAPLYGLYDLDYKPYVNLHRYAQSVMITNYDPEFQTMRELHFGMHPSATGCTLRLGGSHTRKEMFYSLQLMYDRLDETGSLFWWPRATNKKRCLTRCSQGQGAWIQQSTEQWLGIRLHGVEKTLILQPQGLLTDYSLKNAKVGAFRFDIEYHEDKTGTEFYVKNNNACEFKVELNIRPYGTGAEGELKKETVLLQPEESAKKHMDPRGFSVREENIVSTECRSLGNKEMYFGPYGIVMPKLYSDDCNIFLLRFVMGHQERMWKNVKVSIQVPDGFKVTEKKFYYWDYQPIFESDTSTSDIGDLEAGKHGVAGFYISMPDEFAGDEAGVMLSAHPFQVPFGRLEEKTKLLIEGGQTRELAPVKVTLEAGGKIKRSIEIPVIILKSETYKKKYDIMYHD
ncbi:hypothetical protein INP51_12490 [Blautia liquoris]|uniref:Cellobiose phosphorylase n=1 Tax=Blautia liquoris TaxID=2779518 RepID=A0A7M2REY3_9FIRM|nr:hypothetical protein [Blautia liquoris]QOV18809.1 hypothetical protein INP51_12490 [Blautia liquoris]